MVFYLSGRLSDADHNPLPERASSASFNAQTTAAELVRDPEMFIIVPTAPLLAPQPNMRGTNIGRRRTACQNKKVQFT